MKATEAKLLEFIKKSPQFIIPIYQRTYSWTEDECNQLWHDILRTGENEKVAAHFIGSIVYIEKGLYQVSSQSPLLVIDGQQRLTTVTLLIAALANALDECDESKREPIDGFSPRKLRNYYLLNPEEEGERHFKLLLSQTDCESLKSIVAKSPPPTDKSVRVRENFELFSKWIGELGRDLTGLCKGIAKLLVVDVALNRDQDNPQLIFESMNSTGKELTQADLIRNYILMGVEPKLQTKLYNEYWRPMEVDFGQAGYGTHFDPFMRHYLTVKTGEIPNIREVYDAFKKYSIEPSVAEAGVELLVADIRTHAKYFCAMALNAEPNLPLRRAFNFLRELKVDVAYPFLLEMYADYESGVLNAEDFVEAVTLVESFVFRRAVCGIPTNSLNKTFLNFSKALRKDRYLESIKAHLLLLPSYRRFPADSEFAEQFKSRDLYNFGARRSYWLRRMENHGRKELVPVEDYTIEHIIPQNENVSSAWKAELGDDWESIRETKLHSLGNLTLTGYNSEYSDRPFREKRDMEGGFASSPLKLNKGLGQVEKWNLDAIDSRADRVAKWGKTVWPAPLVVDDVLAEYRPAATTGAYGIDDHPNLEGGKTRELFDLLRREVLAFDSCVTEEFLKLYVAFKAETNFVDVVPQVKRLRLTINIPFDEINDSRGLCEDVTGVGTWGNGDVSVAFSNKDDLAYVLDLVRQAFERQMATQDA